MKKPALPLIIYLCQLGLLMWFLSEELTWPSLLVGVLVIVVRIFPIKVHRFAPQILGALVFGYTAWKYGRFVSPEVGLNILFSVVCLKLFEAKEERDWRMLTLGLFLLWSGGALFVKTPLYFLVAISGVLMALIALIKIIGEEVSLSWRQLLRWVVMSLPITILLFFLLPRFQANVWTPPVPPSKGEIGFSEEARPGDVESLSGTGAIAFHATLSKGFRNGDLYWRGATLSGHDGWNWGPSPLDSGWTNLSNGSIAASTDWIKQTIIHRKSVNRAFALEIGQWLESGGKQSQPASNGTWRFGGFQQIRKYTVYSDPDSSSEELSPMEKKSYSLGISLKRLPTFGHLKGRTVEAVINELQDFFQKQSFVYTLSPGKIDSLNSFLREKRGWCAHYASATAMLIRAAGHPARLVSGYLGGNYNSQGKYWTVSEDDAHVWVETWNGVKWLRLDPTLWIAPERSEFSGAEFIRRQSKETGIFNSNSLPAWVRDTQQWIDSINYKFLVWSESFDQAQQKDWAESLNWNLIDLYSAGLWILALSLGGWWIREWWRTRPRSIDIPARRAVWNQWQRWWKKRGKDLSPQWGPERWRLEARSLSDEDKRFALDWINEWEEFLYKKNETPDQLKNLKAKLTR